MRTNYRNLEERVIEMEQTQISFHYRLINSYFEIFEICRSFIPEGNTNEVMLRKI